MNITAETQRKPWTDGLLREKMWTYTTGDRFTRKPIRNDALWSRTVEVRRELIAKALAWREAALADGWTSEATYQHEPEIQAFKLKREGFVVSGLARPATDKTVGSGELAGWAPDGMTIPIGETYDWNALKKGVETCGYCGAFPVKTERVAFVNRACADCSPKEWAKLPHNWAD